MTKILYNTNQEPLFQYEGRTLDFLNDFFLPFDDERLEKYGFSNLKNVYFENELLSGLSAPCEDLSGSCFVNTDLYWSMFTDANLEGAIFRNSCLRGVAFERTNLRNTNFSYCNLSFSAYAVASDFSGADLTNATLHCSNCIGIIIDKKTKLPGKGIPLEYVCFREENDTYEEIRKKSHHLFEDWLSRTGIPAQEFISGNLCPCPESSRNGPCPIAPRQFESFQEVLPSPKSPE